MCDFKIIKTSNDIEDLCITFGLVDILEKNDVEIISIKDKGYYYGVEAEEFDLDDEDEFEYTFDKDDEGKYIIDEFKSCTPVLNKTEIIGSDTKIGSIEKLEIFLKENLKETLSYLLNLDVKKAKKIMKKDNALFCGSVFYTMGMRNNSTVKPMNVEVYKKYLSLLGWIRYVNRILICKKNSIETEKILYFIPKIKDTDELYKVSWKYKKKETDEIKELSMVSNESVNTSLAKMNLNQLEYAVNTDGYEGYYLITMTPTSQKPMSDSFKFINFASSNVSYKLREHLKNKLMNEDLREDVAKYILNMDNYARFSQMIKVVVKKDYYKKDGEKKMSYIDNEVGKEMISLQSTDVKEIYENSVVIKLGRGLNRLLSDDKGYKVQVKLLNTKKSDKLMLVVEELGRIYEKKYITKKGNRAYLLNDEDRSELTKLLVIDGDKSAKIIATAILLNSRIYFGDVIKKESNDDEDLLEDKKDETEVAKPVIEQIKMEGVK